MKVLSAGSAALSIGLGLIALSPALPVVRSASIKPEAAEAWTQYVDRIRAALETRARQETGFLRIGDIPGTLAMLRRGQIVVFPASPHIPERIGGSLIHDWIGTMYLANTKASDVMSVIRNYSRYPDVYAPHILSSKPIPITETADAFSVLFANRSLLSTTAFDCDYGTVFVRIGDRRLYSITRSTRVQEVAGGRAACSQNIS